MPAEFDSTLASLLRAELQITNVECRQFLPTHSTPEQVIDSHRFLLILAGALSYRAENRERVFGGGIQLFVPAWSRRIWRVEGPGDCKLLWAEFLPFNQENQLREMVATEPESAALETAALERMLAIWNNREQRQPLLLEGELKAMLARFFAKAGTEGAAAQPFETTVLTFAETEVEKAIAWISANYGRKDVLSTLQSGLRVHPVTFRKTFAARTGLSLSAYLTMLRMRRARYEIHELHSSIKEVANRAGYEDPFYFSRIYRRFWGHPPTEDRQGRSCLEVVLARGAPEVKRPA